MSDTNELLTESYDSDTNKLTLVIDFTTSGIEALKNFADARYAESCDEYVYFINNLGQSFEVSASALLAQFNRSYNRSISPQSFGRSMTKHINNPTLNIQRVTRKDGTFYIRNKATRKHTKISPPTIDTTQPEEATQPTFTVPSIPRIQASKVSNFPVRKSTCVNLPPVPTMAYPLSDPSCFVSIPSNIFSPKPTPMSLSLNVFKQ